MEAAAHPEDLPLRQAPRVFQWSVFPVVIAAVIAVAAWCHLFTVFSSTPIYK
jgi:hypothetical protein